MAHKYTKQQVFTLKHVWDKGFIRAVGAHLNRTCISLMRKKLLCTQANDTLFCLTDAGREVAKEIFK